MSRCHVLYWIWLSLCVSPGSKSSDLLLEYFEGNAQKIYEASKEEYDKIGIPEETKKKLLNKTSDEAKKILYRCRELGIRILAYDDPLFPERLRRIGKRPVLLYCKGKELDLQKELCIAMVGTRRMTSYGQRTAYTISYDLCRAGAVVVSGLALGIDAVCHRAALDALGNTVAVLGCGVDIAYPKENLDLLTEIENKGMVISEYAPGTRPTRFSFPIRNRIISGLCQGTFVVEGDKTSGAMITAKDALSQGRDLFALPGMVGEQNSEGTNSLLREGAIPVTNAAEILQDYSLLYPDRIFIERIPVYRHEIKMTPVKSAYIEPKSFYGGGCSQAEKDHEKIVETVKNDLPDEKVSRKAGRSEEPEMKDETAHTPPPGLSENALCIYRTIESESSPVSADEIAGKTGLGIATVMTSLSILEIKGAITSLPGGRFTLQ